MRSPGLLVFVVACGGGGSGDGLEIFPDAPMMLVDAAPTTSSALEGMWRFRVCGSNSVSTEITIAGDQEAWRETVFGASDTTCSKPLVIVNTRHKHVIGQPSLGATDARDLDRVELGTTFAVTDPNVAASWNANYYCGYSNWSVGTAMDVSGKTCYSSDGTPLHIPYVGTESYTIFRVDGTKLFFGDWASGSGTSEGTRPTQLGAGYYTRQ